jgi:hypothetical protein
MHLASANRLAPRAPIQLSKKRNQPDNSRSKQMNTFSIEELDREEIEFLPPRVVMTTCQPKPTCYQPCAPKPVCEPQPWCPPMEKCAPQYCPPARCEQPLLQVGLVVKIGLFR